MTRVDVPVVRELCDRAIAQAMHTTTSPITDLVLLAPSLLDEIERLEATQPPKRQARRVSKAPPKRSRR